MKRTRIPGRHNRPPLAAGAVMLWVALSPWIWGFADSGPAVANHIFFTLAFGPLALLIVVLRPAAIVALGGAVWLAASPWVLGYAINDLAWLNELITGALLAVLCSSAAGLAMVRPVRSRAGHPRGGHTPQAAETVGSRS
jgi:hypothetical protein